MPLDDVCDWCVQFMMRHRAPTRNWASSTQYSKNAGDLAWRPEGGVNEFDCNTIAPTVHITRCSRACNEWIKFHQVHQVGFLHGHCSFSDALACHVSKHNIALYVNRRPLRGDYYLFIFFRCCLLHQHFLHKMRRAAHADTILVKYISRVIRCRKVDYSQNKHICRRRRRVRRLSFSCSAPRGLHRHTWGMSYAELWHYEFLLICILNRI